MSRFPWSYLGIPEKCLIDKRVYKKLFFENAKLTVTDKKWFTKDIDTIQWVYSLKPSATLIPAIEEEHYTYDEIAVIEVELENDDHCKRLADIVHRVIPYPLLISFKGEDWVRLSVADKRFNLADSQAATLEEYWVSNRIFSNDTAEVDEAFLQQINYDNQPRLNLKKFYKGWIDAFITYKASQVTGAFVMPDSREDKRSQVKALNTYRSLRQQITDLKTKLKKQEAFNKQVKLNVEIKELEKQLRQTEKQL
jgi:hypothetical protein